MRVENGYEIRGNLATEGRLYQVCNAAGDVLFQCNGLTAALEDAINRDAGNIVVTVVEVAPVEVVAAEVAPVKVTKRKSKPKDNKNV